MAFQVFNFGKQLGLVGGGSHKLPEIQDVQAMPPVQEKAKLPFVPMGGAWIEFPRPGPGIENPRGNPGIGLDRDPYGGGGSRGATSGAARGDARKHPLTIDIDESKKADDERAERIRQIIAQLLDPPKCQQTGTGTAGQKPSDCCEAYQKEMIATVLDELLRDPRLLQIDGLVTCLQSYLNSGKLKITCPDEILYNSINSDEYRDYMRKITRQGVFSVPSGLETDPRFVLAPLLDSCRITLGGGYSGFDAFSILGLNPAEMEKDELCAYLKPFVEAAFKAQYPDKNLSDATSLGAVGRYSIFDLKTGKIYRIVVDENGNKTQGPEIGDWGPCPNL